MHCVSMDVYIDWLLYTFISYRIKAEHLHLVFSPNSFCTTKDLSFRGYLTDEPVRMSPFVNHVEDVSNVNTYATREMAVEKYVTCKAVPVTIESKTYESSFSIKHWRTTISSRNVIVGKATKLHLTWSRVQIFSKDSCRLQIRQ